MKTSQDRILTTHTGSLPRPKALIDLVLEREQGGAVDAAQFEAATAKAVDAVVAQQTAAGGRSSRRASCCRSTRRTSARPATTSTGT
jgi:hypothetical protein